MEPNIYVICAGVAIGNAIGRNVGGVFSCIAVSVVYAIVKHLL